MLRVLQHLQKERQIKKFKNLQFQHNAISQDTSTVFLLKYFYQRGNCAHNSEICISHFFALFFLLHKLS